MKIKKILLEIGGKNVELTVDEAKELMTALKALFGDDKIVFTQPIYVSPVTIPSVWPDKSDPFNPYKVTCETVTASSKVATSDKYWTYAHSGDVVQATYTI